MATLEEIKKAKDAYREVILAMPNVIGVGAGYKVVSGQKTEHLSIIALVKEKIPASTLPSSGRVPSRIDDVLTDVVEVGELRALQDHRARWRPSPAGVSIGHYQITAGTFGCVVRDRKSGAILILSNNHVLANCNDAKEGDAILQPGPSDGGKNPQDMLAVLTRFIPLHYVGDQPEQPPTSCLTQVGIAFAQFFGMNKWLTSLQTPPSPVTNKVDAAVAKPLEDSNLLADILEIGPITSSTTPSLGLSVRKSGRTTALTTGEITVVDSTVTIGYPGNRTARFDNQFLTTPMSEGGDSGSLLVSAAALQAVGLLFAGSDKTTVFSPIQAVLDALEVTL
ncbi:MAG: hypothetical protein IT308_01280 [Anaerolineaceae bacterium]|nr:hypothetical protein [Anaerolineaceae bacterium]